MFPDFQYALESIFDIEVPSFFGFIKTFGFFVAMGFLAAAYILTKELRRMETSGFLLPRFLPLRKAKKFLSKEKAKSANYDKMAVFPHQRVGEIVILALIGGFVGAKIFNALEAWKVFLKDPIKMIISGSGLTFYGGLIMAAVLIFYYCRRHKIAVSHFSDAIAPALMFSYAIGRLGCHFSGDGDWGIYNSGYATLPNGSVTEVPLAAFSSSLTSASSYFTTQFDSLSQVPHLYAPAPSGLPTWLFAMSFPHNVNNEGILIQNCIGDYCYMLPVPVFPTSFYEAVICTLLFCMLWLMRKKLTYPMHLFGVYLILNGAERFMIEKIKVNYKYDWGFIHPTQSEIISILLIITGISIILFYRKKGLTANIILKQ